MTAATISTPVGTRRGVIQGPWRDGLLFAAECFELAERPSHTLTAGLYEVLGHEVIRQPLRPGGIAWRWLDGSRWVRMRDLERSLEDAATLCAPTVNWFVAKGKLRNSEPKFGVQILLDESPVGQGKNDAAPALAFCAAFLRALVLVGPSILSDRPGLGPGVRRPS